MNNVEAYVLHVTKKCNMACTYCYEQDKESEYLWEEVQILLDDMVEMNKEKIFTLEFLGGEPMLRWDLIKMAMEYMDTKDCEVMNYHLTTNGTIINRELIEELRKRPNLNWTVSIDGHKFGNFMRIFPDGENAYDTVIGNFKHLQEALDGDENNQLGAHLVTHHYNVGYLYDGIQDLYINGFRSMVVGTIESTFEIDDEYCNEFMKQMRLVSDAIHDGAMPDLQVSLFNEIKPASDIRHYIRDETGRVILETYGRAKGDIKDSEKYKTEGCDSPIADKIHFIRRACYMYHNRKK